MPSEIKDIKQFIEISRRKDAKCTFPPKPLPPGIAHFPTFSHNFLYTFQSPPFSAVHKCLMSVFCPAARVKKSSKTSDIKFKIRCKRFLYTLVLKDSDKADKLKQSLPPGKPTSTTSCFFSSHLWWVSGGGEWERWRVGILEREKLY
jgi:Ribosomal L38e protein family